jgi:hypothetical protein
MIMHNQRTVNNRQRGMKLLTQELLKKIPPPYAQDGKGGRTIAYARYFSPDSNWCWWACEYDGEDTFFGLVDGHVRELGYFSLTELEELTGPMGLPVERELRFKSMCLQEIAPELFETTDQGDEQ